MPFHRLELGWFHVDAWTLFGRVPVALLFVWLLVAGLRRGWHWRSALLATAAFGAGLSLGTALLPSVLGAIGGGIGAWLVAQRALGLRRPPFAALAVGLTLVVAIGRLGCLCSGCCFGTPSELPWAVHYDHASAPWVLHRALGLVADATPTSLGVHPYPLYESLALVLWLPLVAWLVRRLRSEGAVLALTASYNLAVRAGIDGMRAMLNVWWAKLGVFAGLDRLQWTLVLGALVTLATALALERRARRGAVPVAHDTGAPTESPVPSALATWCVFGSAWLVGLVFDDAQTPFLYRVHVLTLLAAVPAVRLPELRAALRVPHIARQLVAPAVALVLVALLARHVETTLARADEPNAIENTIDERGWLYEVDHRNGTLVRIGSMSEPVAALRARHFALQLGPIPEAPGDPQLELDDERVPGEEPMPEGGARRPQHWLGLEVAGGSARYAIESCGSVTIYDRQFIGAWLRYDAQLPFRETWTASFGGRAGGRYASTTISGGGGAPDRDDDRLAFANAWAEIEEPHFAIGVALYGAFLSAETRDAGMPRILDESFRAYLGGHLRLGFPALSLEIGYLDRDALLGITTARLGFAGMFASGGRTVKRLEDVRIRYGGGMLSYPASRDWLSGPLGFYVFGELLMTTRLVLGLQASYVNGGGMVGLSLRYRVGD